MILFSPYIGKDVACHVFGLDIQVSDLKKQIEQINPLKIKDDFIHKHSFYKGIHPLLLDGLVF